MINIQKYLKPAENAIYSSYVAERISHLNQKTHYWYRLAAAQNIIAFKSTNTNEIKSVDREHPKLTVIFFLVVLRLPKLYQIAWKPAL
jgi:hypothetical protein